VGPTTAKVRLFGPDRKVSSLVELLVDTGSTYSWVDADILKQLGIESRAAWKFKSIDGRMIERAIGDAYMECLGEFGPSLVVFAEKEDGKVLGLHALEGMRLEVAPATGELRKAQAGLALSSWPTRRSRANRLGRMIP
jgi:predicted aspartyl protease